jgi:hypothetical protein
MSIVALKRKTAAKYKNNSVNQRNFSLNGVHRSQGYVGQTMLSRHLPQTPMKGNTPKGHGGCCGTYRVGAIVQSGVNYQEDARTVKSSVVGTDGMISTKYRWTRRPQPFTSVKSDSNHNFNTQQDYIDKLKDKTVNCDDICSPGLTTTKTANCSSYACDSLGIFSRNYINDLRSNPVTFITKPQKHITSESDYITTLRGRLGLIDKYLPRSTNGFPVACGL